MDSQLAHRCFVKFGIKPSEILRLSLEEKVFMWQSLVQEAKEIDEATKK